jgi:hypothetical protein
MIMSMLLTVCFPADPLDAQAEGTQKGELPASFDLRSVDTDGDGVGDRCYVTPVRFQNPFATCWVFAGISAAEISLLGSVYADDPEAWKTLDLSEKQLGYFSHMLLNDPTSPQNGEGTTAADPTDMFEVYGGGSTLMALEAFAQGIGPSLVLVIMIAFGYVGANEGNQVWEVAVNMRYIVAATFLFSAILQFVGLGLVYNLDKKTLAEMNRALGREEESEAVATNAVAEGSDDLA